MFEPFLERWSKAYQAEVGAELKKYGLRVDDLLDPDWHPVRSETAQSACIHVVWGKLLHPLTATGHCGLFSCIDAASGAC